MPSKRPRKKKVIVRKKRNSVNKKVVRSSKRKTAKQKKRINLLNPLWFGLFFLILAAFLKTQLSSPLPIASTKILNEYKNEVDYSKLPSKIEIPRLNLSLTVKQTTIENGKWGVSADSASHLLSSATPGEKGNIIIYGHNKPKHLKDLGKVGFGDSIRIKTIDGKSHVYKITNKSIVWPNQIEFLNPTKEETLTLYTCTGFADAKRLVIRALPVTINLPLTSLE